MYKRTGKQNRGMSTDVDDLHTKHAWKEEKEHASTGGNDLNARHAGEEAYASTGGYDLDARHAGEGAYASTG
eukprot:477513-Hanusia_phi.AAC.1